MKNIIISTVASLAVLAFAGCAPKTSCSTTPVKAPVKPVVASNAKPVVVTPEPVVVESVDPVVVPMVDAKESAVQ